jgi:hypothetical protein
VARNGLFVQKENSVFGATVPVTQLQHLQAVEPEVTLKVPPLSGDLFQQAFLFFRKVFQIYRSEAILLLYYGGEKGYLLYCPGQKVSYASLRYEEAVRIEGYVLAGSIHSHGGMPAFHSPTDQGDEANFDGIHVTVGNIALHSNRFSLSCQLAVNANRFDLEPERVMDGMVRCVTKAPAFGSALFSGKIYGLEPEPRKEFEIELIGDTNPGFPEEWLAKVQEATPSQTLPGVSTWDPRDWECAKLGNYLLVEGQSYGD